MIRSIRLSVILAAAVALSACGTTNVNYVTGQEQRGAYTWAQEVQIGTEADQQISAQYGIYEDEGQTDDEISALLREELHRDIPGYMFWDCTGIFFTTSIYWQRTPCGIVVIHRMSRDV